MKYDTVIFMGPPGSGKGTQAKLLATKLGWERFSTGDRFKELREGSGALSERVREAYDAGRLMPDWFATYLFENAILNLPEGKGIVFDGYPRSVAQAGIFHETCEWLGRSYTGLNLAVPDEETMRRQIARAKEEHRPDSATEDQVLARLATYRENTAPVLEYLEEKGKLITLDGTPTPEEIAADILAKLDVA